MGPEREPAYRPPVATYRLQFGKDLTFKQSTELAGYLRRLGISDLYASPLFPAGPQSTHGYDVCGFEQVNSCLGSAEEFETLVESLKSNGLGLLLDMVPNHMGTDLSNLWWWDVLENGPASPYSQWFDIDWTRWSGPSAGKVVLPTLEDHYCKVLEDRKLKIVLEAGTLSLEYHDRRFPLSAASLTLLFDNAISKSEPSGAVGDTLQKLRSLLGDFAPGETPRAALQKFKEELASSCVTVPGLALHLAQTLRELNAPPHKFTADPLHPLIQAQHYRLAFWRVGPEEINYRRFFDVTELVCLRMEDPQVFAAAHRFVFELIEEGKVNGLRIDHPDGLWDPGEYFQRLQEHFDRTGKRRLYVVVEKILTGEEPLPESWPVDGTTGYDFLNKVNRLFVEPKSRRAFDAIYAEFTGETRNFSDLVYAGKKQILENSLISELDALTVSLKQLAALTAAGQDLTFRQLRAILTGVIAAFPVYRTYTSEKSDQVSALDREHIEAAVHEARCRSGSLEEVGLSFIRKVLSLDFDGEVPQSVERLARTFVMRFQQLTGPVMAKGVEDTAFYNYNRLISLNEVGGDPAKFGTTISAFHDWNQARVDRWHQALLATATHDTKRGEDLRARLNVLSEMPGLWREAIRRWQAANLQFKSAVDGSVAPHATDEYLFYQTLIGAWTSQARTADGLAQLRERVSSYMLKAIKEAKARTSWTTPNSPYEQATRNFVESVLQSPENDVFLSDFIAFQRTVSFFGVFNSLSQLLLKITCPGIPDFYQGSEFWDFNLVDPDNRRPVIFKDRMRALDRFESEFQGDSEAVRARIGSLLDNPESGELKLFVTWRTLRFRHKHPELFTRGEYIPLQTRGPKADHICAFARHWQSTTVMILVPRLVFGLTSGKEKPPIGPNNWAETELVLPASMRSGGYRDIFTGQIPGPGKSDRRFAVATLLSHLPVALLISLE